MHATRHTVNLTTAADGSATGYTDVANGRVLQVHYLPDGSTPYANTVDVTITSEATGQGILTKSNVAAAFHALPRVPTQVAADGTDALYAAAGTEVREPVVVANDRVKIVLAQGGDTKTGRFDIVIG